MGVVIEVAPFPALNPTTPRKGGKGRLPAPLVTVGRMRVDLVALLLPLVLSSLNDHSQRILERIREGSTIIRIVPPVYLLTIGGGPLGVVPPLSLGVAPGRRDPPDTTAPMVGVPGAVEGVTVIEAVDAMVVEEKPHAVVPIDGLPESIGVENVPTPAQSPVPAIGDEIHPQISQNRLHARHPSPLLPLPLVLQARITRGITLRFSSKPFLISPWITLLYLRPPF